MGHTLTLTADDGHSLGAYRADASGAARGGIVVLQEIFGVNSHIRSVCDGFAADGFTCVAPRALRPLVAQELRTRVRSRRHGRRAASSARSSRGTTPCGTLPPPSRCWPAKGSRSARSDTAGEAASRSSPASRLDVSAAVVYYGGQITPYKDEKARCPMLMHFGEHDTGIPLSYVEQVRTAQPEAAVHVYDAGHGFNCDHRASYDEASAKLARRRTIEFFDTHLG